METTNAQLSQNETDESINLVETLYRYLRHWKWFIASFTVAMCLAVGLILVTPKEYQPSMSILLNEEKGSRGSGSSDIIDINALGMLNMTSNIENEIVVLQSPDLIDQVVRNLDLNITYYTYERFRRSEIYKESPFTVSISTDENDFAGACRLSIQKKGEGYLIEGIYELEVADYELKINQVEKQLPATIRLSEEMAIAIDLSGKELNEDKTYEVEVAGIPATTRAILDNLTVVSAAKNASVLNLSIRLNNRQKGADFLHELLEQYNDLNLRVNNEMAYNSAMFINDRLKEISVELSDAEEEVVEYKQQHRIADLSSEAQLFVSQTGENEAKLLEIETELNVLSLIQNFINNPENNTKTIPNMGLSDVGLTQIISEYNNKLLASDQLLKGTGDKNPARVRVFEELDNMREGIKNSLGNVRKTYSVSLNDLRKRSSVTQSRISSVPKQERGLIEKVREQKIKESLFLFLMQKREETNLSIAASSQKARIVASPRLNILPVSPKSKMILLAFAILGILLPIVVIYVRELLQTKITNREDFERMSRVSVIGEIGVNTGKDQIVHKDQGALAEMFRTLRNNVRFATRKKSGVVLLITSTMANEGKSFVSLNLALSFARTGKKVLLIGGDIRNPQIRENMNNNALLKQQGLSDYLIDSDSDWSKYISTPLPENETFQVMVAGTIPPNPNELLMDPRLPQLIDEAREVYDYVIIDSAPVGLVSDSYLIGEYTDLSLYVVRENKTPKTAINFINMQQEQQKLKNMYVILNETALRGSYSYGYGKEYGYENSKK